MPSKSNNNKKTILNFLKEHSDAVSRDNNVAKNYLKSQGKNPDAFANELLKKIKKTQLEINANKNSTFFNSLTSLRQLAAQKAKEIIKSPGFSLPNFMQKEKFTLQNRNLEELDQEEIQSILENYFFLKMQQDNSENNDL